MDNRIGMFRIGESFYREAELGGYLGMIADAVFKDKFVLRCEFLASSRNFEYIALDTSGKDFEALAVGEEAPMYICNLVITKAGDEEDGSDAAVCSVVLEDWARK